MASLNRRADASSCQRVSSKRAAEDRTHIERVWKEGNGDCRQELVLIGRDMDPQALTTMLDECLLTDEELSTDEGAWHLRFTDPFPEWTLESDGMAG